MLLPSHFWFIMPDIRREGRYKMTSGVCLSVRLSVACLDPTQEGKFPKIARMEVHHTGNT